MRKLLLPVLTMASLLICSCASKQHGVLTSNLSKDQISTVVASHRNEIRACYEQVLKKHPDATGKVVVQFIVDPSGLVASASIKDRTIASEGLGECVISKFRTWEFPKAIGPTEVIQYPIYMSHKKS